MKQLVYGDKIGVYDPKTDSVMTCQLTDNNNFYKNDDDLVEPDPNSIQATNYNRNYSELHIPVVKDHEELFYHDLLVEANFRSGVGVVAMTFSIKF